MGTLTSILSLTSDGEEAVSHFIAGELETNGGR
jgi:hypothetical protein